jgi:peptidyl-prolyl cis-trans isomerase D
MFDLFRSRDRLVRILLSGLLLIVALSMVTYLIPSYGSGDRGPDTVVAEIGKENITSHDIQLAVRNAVRGRSMPQDMVAFYVPQMVEGMVNERAMVFEAQRLGIRASDEDTYNAIRVMAPSLFPGGQFVGRDTYAAMLAQQNLTIPEFESSVARQILISRLQDIVVSGIVVSPTEIEQEYRRRNEKASVQYVKLTTDKFKAEVQVTPAEIKDYYDKNRASFPVPEKKNLAILILDQARIEQSIVPSEPELHRVYENEKEKFRSPERILTRHILLMAKTPEEDAKVKPKADALVKELKGGGDFAALATKNSQDPGSAPKGGDLGWLVRGQTVKPFEDAAFALKPKEISDPVKSQFGYHIIQVLDHQQPYLKSFEEARSQLLDEVRKERAGKIMQDLIDRAQSALRKEPADTVAKELNLAPPIQAENISAGDAIPTIGANKDFDQSVSALQKGEVSQPVSLPANRVALAVVTGIVPTHPASLEESAEKIRRSLEEQKAAARESDRANELVAKAKAMNGDLEKAAKSMGLEVKTPPPFGRSSAVEGLGASASLGQAFETPEGSLIGPIPVPGGGRVVAKVLSHIPADMSQLPAQTAGLRDELRRRKADERNGLFVAGLREQLIKEGKVKIHQNVVKQLVANYRG